MAFDLIFENFMWFFGGVKLGLKCQSLSKCSKILDFCYFEFQ